MLELRLYQAADCSRGGFQPPETHDCQQWTAVYVGSLAVRMTTTRDCGDCSWWHVGCGRRDTVASDHLRIST